MDYERAKESLTEYTDWYLYLNAPHKSFACDYLSEEKTISAENDSVIAFLVGKLIEECEEHNGKIDFNINYVGSPFRCHRIESYDGVIIQLRRFTSVAPKLEELGLPKRFTSIASSEKLNSGLVIVGGAHGNGKSTTLAGFVLNRLNKFGGLCLTIEDPIEFPLHGKHGKGYCIQTNAESDGFDSGGSPFAKGIKGAMRSYPVSQNGILMLGEVRDAETAAEACRASVNGLLVCCSIHANSPYDILHRIEALAARAIDVEEVRTLLAAGFKMLIHQKLRRGQLSSLTLTTNQSVSSKLSEGKYKNLSTEVEKENNLLRRM